MRLLELRRVSPLRCANVLAVVNAAIAGSMVVFTVSQLAAKSGRPPPPFLPAMLGVMALAYPVMGSVIGWVWGGLGALVDNWVVRYTGGIEVQGEEIPL